MISSFSLVLNPLDQVVPVVKTSWLPTNSSALNFNNNKRIYSIKRDNFFSDPEFFNEKTSLTLWNLTSENHFMKKKFAKHCMLLIPIMKLFFTLVVYIRIIILKLIFDYYPLVKYPLRKNYG